MAASDELPRGVTLTASSTGGAASVTFSASPGVSWVVTDIQAQAIAETATGTGLSAGMEILTNSTLLALVSLPPNSPQGTVAEESWQGQYPMPVGSAVQVGLSNGGTDYNTVITVTAYPA